MGKIFDWLEKNVEVEVENPWEKDDSYRPQLPSPYKPHKKPIKFVIGRAKGRSLKEIGGPKAILGLMGAMMIVFGLQGYFFPDPAGKDSPEWYLRLVIMGAGFLCPACGLWIWDLEKEKEEPRMYVKLLAVLTIILGIAGIFYFLCNIDS